MQAHPILFKALLLKLRIAPADANGRARAHVIQKVRTVIDLGHTELRQ